MAILRKGLRYWYWFAIGLILALVAAFIYIRTTPRVYSVDATLQIKDEKGGGVSNIQDDILSQLTLLSGTSNLQNEIVVLKSYPLVGQVVKKLGLQTVYIPDAGSKASLVDLYKKSPILVSPITFKKEFSPVKLTVTTRDNKRFKVSDDNGSVTVPAGEIAHLRSGDFMIRINPQGSDSIYQTLHVTTSPLNNTVAGYVNKLDISQTDKTSSSLILKIKTTVPARGKDFLNTLLSEYQKAGLVEKNEMATNTIRFVTTRLDSLMGELNAVETHMAQFMSQNGMANIDEQSKLFLDQASQVDQQLTQSQLKLSILQEIEKYMKQPQENHTLVPSTLGIADPTLLRLVQEYNTAQLTRSQQVQAGAKPGNPLIVTLDHQISELRTSIKENVQNLQEGVKIGIQRLENQNDAFQNRIRQVPELQKQFLAIKRRHEVKQALFNYLQQKREEASITKEASVNTSTIINPALVNPAPVSPKGKLIYLAAFLIGLIVPGGMLYLKETLNRKITSRKDIENITQLPIYGEIMTSKKKVTLVVRSGLRSPISEQFRNLRTNLNFVLGSGGTKKTILITSSMSGEGKSFVALNLAMTYALLGKRTVLLNMDLRRPKLERYLNLDHGVHPGISNYLSGEASLEELPDELTFGEHNLYFINSGPVPPNPAELMLQPEMDQLIEFLKERFDYILLDTPPIGIVADAQVLGKYADTTLYAIRHSHTSRDQVKMLDILYREKKVPRPGIVLNGIKARDTYRYGYGDYRSSYYYAEDGHAEVSVYQKIKDSLKGS